MNGCGESFFVVNLEAGSLVSVGAMFEYKSGVQGLNMGGFQIADCRKWSLIHFAIDVL